MEIGLNWKDNEVIDCLRANSCALWAADMDENPCAELVHTADWGYVRLRGEGYTDEELAKWIERIRSQNGNEKALLALHSFAFCL